MLKEYTMRFGSAVCLGIIVLILAFRPLTAALADQSARTDAPDDPWSRIIVRLEAEAQEVEGELPASGPRNGAFWLRLGKLQTEIHMFSVMRERNTTSDCTGGDAEKLNKLGQKAVYSLLKAADLGAMPDELYDNLARCVNNLIFAGAGTSAYPMVWEALEKLRAVSVQPSPALWRCRGKLAHALAGADAYAARRGELLLEARAAYLHWDTAPLEGDDAVYRVFDWVYLRESEADYSADATVKQKCYKEALLRLDEVEPLVTKTDGNALRGMFFSNRARAYTLQALSAAGQERENLLGKAVAAQKAAYGMHELSPLFLAQIEAIRGNAAPSAEFLRQASGMSPCKGAFAALIREGRFFKPLKDTQEFQTLLHSLREQ